MVTSPFTAFILVGSAAGINSVAQIQKGRSPFGVLMAGAVLGTICVAANEITRSQLGTLLAAAFLLSSILTNGTRLFDTLTKAVENY